jgi:hypothetical protein
MFHHDFRRAGAGGFVLQPPGPCIAPDLEHAGRLTQPTTIAEMFMLLGEQVRLHRRSGIGSVTAGPPLHVALIEPGRVERFVRADLDAEPSIADLEADKRIERERRASRATLLPAFAQLLAHRVIAAREAAVHDAEAAMASWQADLARSETEIETRERASEKFKAVMPPRHWFLLPQT